MPQPLKDFIESGIIEFRKLWGNITKDTQHLTTEKIEDLLSQRTTQAYELGKQDTLAMVMREIEDEDKRWNENGEHYANVSQALSTLKQKLSGNGE